MAHLPAICLNPTCRTIFPSGFAIIGGVNISYVGNTSGPCPKCGGMGKVPDGNYSNIGDKLFVTLNNLSDASVFKQYSELLKRELLSNKSPEQIIQSVNQNFPELRSVSDLIPKTRSDAYAFIGILIALISLIISSYQAFKSGEPENIDFRQQIFNQSFHNYYLSQDSAKNYVHDENQSDTHN